MNDARMLARNLRMTVFDLPSHGRSFPPDDSVPGEHYNSEDRYIEIIAAMIKKLSFKKTIVRPEARIEPDDRSVVPQWLVLYA
jgi:pimeloyl-ACP methyl ester carboxylesterase